MNYSSLPCDKLVRACAKSGNAEAWEEFVCRFEKLIITAVWRVARQYGEKDKQIVKDLTQDTFKKICDDDRRLLREFNPHYEDAFFGMLKVTAANIARDYFRARNSEKRGSGKASSELNETKVVVADSRFGPGYMEKQVLLQEIDRMLRSICSLDRDREIFWLHYRHGISASDIAKMNSYGVTAKGVESILFRLRSQLRSKLVHQTSTNKVLFSPEGIQKRKSFQGEGQP